MTLSSSAASTCFTKTCPRTEFVGSVSQNERVQHEPAADGEATKDERIVRLIEVEVDPDLGTRSEETAEAREPHHDPHKCSRYIRLHGARMRGDVQSVAAWLRRHGEEGGTLQQRCELLVPISARIPHARGDDCRLPHLGAHSQGLLVE